MDRVDALTTLVVAIDRVERPGPILVGIDGIDAAGKTTLADELVVPLQQRGRRTVCVSIDGFHKPRAQRLARGALSPEGYFHDSFDYAHLLGDFIKPAKAMRHHTTLRAAIFDVANDRAVCDRTLELQPGTIVLFDGVFLFRPELVGFWDFRIFVEIGFDTSLARGITRDARLMGGEAAARERYLQRYIPGQRLYFEAARPIELADVVVRNDDPTDCRIVMTGRSGPAPPTDG